MDQIPKFDLHYIDLPNGERYSYRQKGLHHKKVILLIHGQMTTSIFFDVLIDKLYHDFRVIAPDLRGCGHSSYNFPINSHEDLANDLKLLLDSLFIPKVDIVLGWSAGAATMMTFALNYPDKLNKLILLCAISPKGVQHFKEQSPFSELKPYQSKREFLLDLSIRMILEAFNRHDEAFFKKIWDRNCFNMNRPDERKYHAYIQDVLLQRGFGDHVYASHIFNITNDDNGVTKGTGKIKKIQAKTLIISAENDKIISPIVADDWLSGLGSLASLVILRNCGHVPTIDSLDALTDHIEKFANKPQLI